MHASASVEDVYLETVYEQFVCVQVCVFDDFLSSNVL